MQLEIRNAVERDRLVYNALGFTRRLPDRGAVLPPHIVHDHRRGAAAGRHLLALGALGWLDFRLNMFLNVMTPLIMVISFSDSMQLTFAARDRLLAGDDKYKAFRNALLIVGTGLRADPRHGRHFVHRLAVFQSDLIRTFGEAGLIATLIALFAVLMMVPLLGVLLMRNEGGFRYPGQACATWYRARRAAPVLRLDRPPHGRPARALQP